MCNTYMYIHAYMHTCIHAYIYIRTYTLIDTCIHVYMYRLYSLFISRSSLPRHVVYAKPCCSRCTFPGLRDGSHQVNSAFKLARRSKFGGNFISSIVITFYGRRTRHGTCQFPSLLQGASFVVVSHDFDSQFGSHFMRKVSACWLPVFFCLFPPFPLSSVCR